jgi:hypothetical protein
MRRARFLLAVSSIVITSITIWATGCSTFYEDCINGTCVPFQPKKARFACPGEPTTDPTLVKDACGLFVRGDAMDTDDEGSGTKDRPYRTLQAAINAVVPDDVDSDAGTSATKDAGSADAGSGAPALKYIFVCTKNILKEGVTITKDYIAIYGGFDCANGWAWDKAARSTILSPSDAPALVVSGQHAHVENFSLMASRASTAGGSSIAVLVNRADPVFTRCEMIADTAQQGKDGDSVPPVPADSGVPGNNGANTCSADPVKGGASIPTPSCPTSVGGNGGQGSAGSSEPGGTGQPQPTASQGGEGGDAETSTACSVGRDGAAGDKGPAGSGAIGDMNLGNLDPSGFIPASGSDGQPGQPGQGGGGGGGAKGGAQCTGATKGGASGGSGGSGGCGGQAGKGGKGAGASIALISLDSPAMTLTDVSLTAAAGVRGGNGGRAQAAGSGAAGGLGGTSSVVGLNAGCKGGFGGPGGDGGTGGGGRGGHSIGLAYTGKRPEIAVENITVSNPGQGGLGGNNNLQNNQGDDGIRNEIQEFPLKQ